MKYHFKILNIINPTDVQRNSSFSFITEYKNPIMLFIVDKNYSEVKFHEILCNWVLGNQKLLLKSKTLL